LEPGAKITGRIVDPQTGQGVFGSIRYSFLPENKAADEDAKRLFHAFNRSIKTTPDGSFEFTTIPGPMIVVGQAQADGGLLMDLDVPYLPVRPLPERKDLFHFDERSKKWQINLGISKSFGRLEDYHTLKILDPKVGENKPVELTLKHGAKVTLDIRDPEGRAIEKNAICGVSTWSTSFPRLHPSNAVIMALDSETPRQVVIINGAKKLGGMVTLRGDEKSPVTVKLAPLGEVSGRFLNADGQPLTYTEVSVYSEESVVTASGRGPLSSGESAVGGRMESRFGLRP
jgi:hypothetical protein